MRRLFKEAQQAQESGQVAIITAINPDEDMHAAVSGLKQGLKPCQHQVPVQPISHNLCQERYLIENHLGITWPVA